MGFYKSTINCLGVDDKNKHCSYKISVQAHSSLGRKIKILSDVSLDVLPAINNALYLNQRILNFSNDLSIRFHSKHPLTGQSCGLGLFLCIFAAITQAEFKDSFYCTGCIDTKGRVLKVDGLEGKLNIDMTNSPCVLIPKENITDDIVQVPYMSYAQYINHAILCAFTDESIVKKINLKYGENYLFELPSLLL